MDHVILGERASAAPAVAYSGGQIHLAWTGADRHLNLASSADGRRYDGKRTVSHTTSTRVVVNSGGDSLGMRTDSLGPSLAATGNGLVLGWTRGGRLNVALAATPEHAVALDQTSPGGPALAAWGDDALLAWTGTDSHVNLAVVRGWMLAHASRLDAVARSAPAVCAYGREVALAWEGDRRRVTLALSREGSFASPICLDETTNEAPALCTVGDRLVLAWTGTDFGINLVVAAPQWGQPVRLDAKTPRSPALCALGDELVVAWAGTDRRLNVKRLRPPP